MFPAATNMKLKLTETQTLLPDHARLSISRRSGSQSAARPRRDVEDQQRRRGGGAQVTLAVVQLGLGEGDAAAN